MSHIIMEKIVQVWCFGSSFLPSSSSPSPRLPSLLLCQLLWGGLEGMLMASCPHTPRPHMPLVGMWLFTTKAYWNFTPPMLWVFFLLLPAPHPTPLLKAISLMLPCAFRIGLCFLFNIPFELLFISPIAVQVSEFGVQPWEKWRCLACFKYEWGFVSTSLVLVSLCPADHTQRATDPLQSAPFCSSTCL